MKPVLLFATFIGLITFDVVQLRADIITAVSISTDMGDSGITDIDNTINGVGLSAYPSLVAQHDDSTPSNAWLSSIATPQGNIDFDLGQTFLVDGFSFWNHSGSPGIQAASVLASNDGVSFNLIGGSPTSFAMVSSGSAFSPEVFSFQPVQARHIRFQVTSNYGASLTGFSEAAFSGAAVPEPSSFALLGIAIAGIAARCIRTSKGTLGVHKLEKHA